MTLKSYLLVIVTLVSLNICAQPIEVQADYNGVGDCIFTANNNTRAPMYLHLNFADIENTTFNEPLPYVKRLDPGFSSLFTLSRDPDTEVPRFNYEIKTYRSDPMANINFDFPYLIPLKEGQEVRAFDVKSIGGFWGSSEPKSWHATGFVVTPGNEVFVSRNGIVVEVVGKERQGDSQYWYHTWANAVTLLQDDGTLACYHNVIGGKHLKIGEKIYAGQLLGKVVHGEHELVFLVFHDSLYTKSLSFVIPQFVIYEGKIGILNSKTVYSVSHPGDVRKLEMSKRERKKILGIK